TSSGYDANGVPGGDLRIDRLDLSSGARSRWVPSAQMPASEGPQGDMIFVEEVKEQSQDPSIVGAIGERLARARADGSTRSIIVDDNALIALYGPNTSPDGKWAAFAAINIPRMGYTKQFDLFRWLGLEPEVAYAHGLPWEL